MNMIDIEKEGIILPKEISFVPYSNEVNYRTFSAVLDDNKMSATYKMYWLLALLEEIQL
ncbi:HNH endonuclease, partial [Clostridium botulinum]|nr:HNH endonuclease [Clostridium botulinum]